MKQLIPLINRSLCLLAIGLLTAHSAMAQPPGGRGGFGGPPGGRGGFGGPQQRQQGGPGQVDGQQQRRGGQQNGGSSPVLLALDVDSNRILSAAEIANAPAALAALDANGDGQLTSNEVTGQNGVAGPPRGRRNGGVGPNGPTAAQFVQRANTFDTDGDGVLNQTELAAMADAVVAELQGR